MLKSLVICPRGDHAGIEPGEDHIGKSGGPYPSSVGIDKEYGETIRLAVNLHFSLQEPFLKILVQCQGGWRISSVRLVHRVIVIIGSDGYDQAGYKDQEYTIYFFPEAHPDEEREE